MISGFNELLAGCAVVLYRRHSLFVYNVVLTTASNVHSSPHLLLLLLFQVLLLLLLLTVLVILTVCNCVCWDVNSVVVVVVHVIINDVSGCVYIWIYTYIYDWCSTNYQLENGAILLIFTIWKNVNYISFGNVPRESEKENRAPCYCS